MKRIKPNFYILAIIIFVLIVGIQNLYYLFNVFHSSNQLNEKNELHEITTVLDQLEKEYVEIKSLVSQVELSQNPFETKNIRGSPPSPASEKPLLQVTKPPSIALDNGLNVQILPPKILSSNANDPQISSVLVVCGTDGSGTRRVVQILTELGVKMVSEDPETYDIHGDIMGGWPPIVKPVIESAKSLNYDAHLHPSHPQLNTQIEHHLQNLLNQAERDSHKPESFKLAVGGTLPIPLGIKYATGVKFGFKAPVAMTLSPWWARLLPHVKILHVTRDGRDIAFSANQGPVEKFYASMYGIKSFHADSQGRQMPTDGLSNPVQGVRLWSDWNSQLHDWAQEYSSKLASQPENQGLNPDRSLSYHHLHSEDLVSDNIAHRMSALHALAHWVGSDLVSSSSSSSSLSSADSSSDSPSLSSSSSSSLTTTTTTPTPSTIEIEDYRLCCVVGEESSFLGSHDRSQLKQTTNRILNNNNNQQQQQQQQLDVNKRYGKWKKNVQNNPNLEKELNHYGELGLKLFGYEPIREPPLILTLTSSSSSSSSSSLINNNNVNNNNHKYNENSFFCPYSILDPKEPKEEKIEEKINESSSGDKNIDERFSYHSTCAFLESFHPSSSSSSHPITEKELKKLGRILSLTSSSSFLSSFSSSSSASSSINNNNNNNNNNQFNNKQCIVYPGVDFKGADLSFSSSNSLSSCCELCTQTHGCSQFTYSSFQSVCYLKTSKGKMERKQILPNSNSSPISASSLSSELLGVDLFSGEPST